MEQPNRPPSLPNDIHENVFERLKIVDKVNSARTVCHAWSEFYEQPRLWKVLCMREYPPTLPNVQLVEMCKYAVAKSAGQLEEVYIDNVATNDLLEMIVDSSRLLKVLHLHNCNEVTEIVFRQTIPRLEHLQELSLSVLSYGSTTIHLIGTSCPLLTSFSICMDNYNEFDGFNAHAYAIGTSMTQLRNLRICVTGNLTNAAVEAMLSGCQELVSLDLENCVNLVLTEDMQELCLSRVKKVKLPPNYWDDTGV